MSEITEAKKQKLKDGIYLKNRILVEGVAFNPDIFKNNIDLGGTVFEQVNVLFSRDKHAHPENRVPRLYSDAGGKIPDAAPLGPEQPSVSRV